MMYLLALICPPLALVLVGAPVRAFLVTLMLGLAATTWSSGVGMILAALTILWACNVVGDARARRELDGFLETFQEDATPRLG